MWLQAYSSPCTMHQGLSPPNRLVCVGIKSLSAALGGGYSESGSFLSLLLGPLSTLHCLLALCSTATLLQSLPIMFEYLIGAVALYMGYSLVCLELNYRRALSMGIPLVRLPIDPLNVPFQVIEPHLFKLLDLLPPNALPVFVRYMRRGWFFPDKADSYLRYGPIFAFVTPRGIHIQVCDSEAIHDIFTRRLDFVRPSENYSKPSRPAVSM